MKALADDRASLFSRPIKRVEDLFIGGMQQAVGGMAVRSAAFAIFDDRVGMPRMWGRGGAAAEARFDSEIRSIARAMFINRHFNAAAGVSTIVRFIRLGY